MADGCAAPHLKYSHIQYSKPLPAETVTQGSDQKPMLNISNATSDFDRRELVGMRGCTPSTPIE